MKKLVKFTAGHGIYNAGEVAGFDPAESAKLIAEGKAVGCTLVGDQVKTDAELAAQAAAVAEPTTPTPADAPKA